MNSGDQDRPSRHAARSCLGCFLHFFIGLTGLLLVSGSVLRLSIRDRLAPWSAIYYATPVLVLAMLGGILVVHAIVRKRWRRAIAWGIVAGLWAWVGIQTEFPDAADPPASDEQLVVLWNMLNGHKGWDQAFDELLSAQPRIAGLVESWHDHQRPTFAQDLPREYHCTDSAHGLTIIAQGPLEQLESGQLGPHGRYRSALVRLDGAAIRVIVVDIESNPFRSRQVAFEALRRLVDRYLDQPLLVMGDFNTPYDSEHAKILAAVLTHAFRTHGSGYAATWPLPVPLLELDHVWFNESIEVTRSSHTASNASDHEMVKVYCRFPEPRAAGKIPTTNRR